MQATVMTVERVNNSCREACAEGYLQIAKVRSASDCGLPGNRLARRDNPRELGEALTGPLAGLWKYREGSFRILTRIDDSALAIWVVQVGDRREVYR
ncbi:type II toxin-antitoxin system RelE/ParE family toxin [Mesorhizobium sp.]|uniref:type II toxin-antitoxin system RelE family toxin n=1 Tax=Mesorhizobium sp. TaxID=1871066 RepID=UPI00338F8AF4